MILNFNELIKKYNCNINGVLHVGAHHGEEYKLYKQFDINPIVFIEALPHTFKKLKENVGEECICINTAIGNINGNVSMYVESKDANGSSSILAPKLHLQQHPQVIFDARIDVPITRIDDIDLPICNFLNMDIQGYELEALKGAEKYLNNIKYAILEINRDQVYDGCAHVDELDNFLSNYNLVRVETDWAGYIWGDGFYIKK